jgi:hypothetical protein
MAEEKPFKGQCDITSRGRPGAGGMAQVAECLTSKCEALSSNPVLQKKSKTKI